MSEEMIVKYCSPTLAGLKTGSMFTSFFENKCEMHRCICSLNRMLTKKGLRVLPLKFKQNSALIYIFRPSRLCDDLTDDTARRILSERGYCVHSPNRCIVQLIERLRESGEFPHEIGLFLGYPPQDVCGFIENKAEKCRCCGCWKVYSDEKAAMKTFERYKKCTDVYCAHFANGAPIEKLTVCESLCRKCC